MGNKLDSTGCCPKCGCLIQDMSHEPLKIKEPYTHCVPRKEYKYEQRLGRTVGNIIEVGGRLWQGVVWEDEDSPDFFKASAMMYFTSEKQAREYLTGLKDKEGR